MKILSDAGNRIGTVSSVDEKTGMVSVIYDDLDGEVTDYLPYATFNEEYKLPKPGAKVVVLHLSNGGEMGVVLGTFWNENNIAENHGEYHKEIGNGACLDCENGTLTLVAEHMRLVSTGDNADITIARLVKDIEQIKEILGIT